MAFVSQATVDKRDVRDWLAQRHSSTVAGVQPQGQFTGYYRATCVVRHRLMGSVGESAVWCVLQDGSIAARSAATGEDLGSPIPAVKGCSPTALTQVGGGEVWVGYSTGAVHVHDAVSKELLGEIKKHSGAVTVIHDMGRTVATGSEDFLILLWEAATHKALGALPGHTNHVSALAHVAKPELLLYSGSADGTVRCWNVAGRYEVTDESFPLRHARRAPIVTLCVSEGCLFTASTKEIGIWKLPAAELATTIAVEDQVSSMCVCDSSLTLWYAQGNGVITIFNLYNFEKVGELTEHSNTVVPATFPTARTVVNRLFLLADGRLDAFTAESDSVPQSYEPFDEVLRGAECQAEEMRTELVEHSTVLQTKRAHLAGLQHYDESQTTAAATALGSTRAVAFKERVANNFADHRQRERNHLKRLTVMRALEHRATHAGLFERFSRWMRVAARRSETSFQARARGMLRRTVDRDLQATYLHTAMAAARRHQRAKVAAAQAIILAQRSQRRALGLAFATWGAFLARHKAARRVQPFVIALQRQNDRQAAAVAWTTVASGADQVELKKIQKAAAEAMLATTRRYAAKIAFAKWIRLIKIRRVQVSKAVLGDKLAADYPTNLCRSYMHRWLAAVNERRVARLDGEVAELEGKVAEVERIINDPDVLTAEELDEETAAVMREIAAVERDIEGYRMEAADANDAMDRAAVAVGKAREGAPLKETVQIYVDRLKIRNAVRVRHDSDVCVDTVSALASGKSALRILATLGEDVSPRRRSAAVEDTPRRRSTAYDDGRSSIAGGVEVASPAVASFMEAVRCVAAPYLVARTDPAESPEEIWARDRDAATAPPPATLEEEPQEAPAQEAEGEAAVAEDVPKETVRVEAPPVGFTPQAKDRLLAATAAIRAAVVRWDNVTLEAGPLGRVGHVPEAARAFVEHYEWYVELLDHQDKEDARAAARKAAAKSARGRSKSGDRKKSTSRTRSKSTDKKAKGAKGAKGTKARSKSRDAKPTRARSAKKSASPKRAKSAGPKRGASKTRKAKSPAATKRAPSAGKKKTVGGGAKRAASPKKAKKTSKSPAATKRAKSPATTKRAKSPATGTKRAKSPATGAKRAKSPATGTKRATSPAATRKAGTKAKSRSPAKRAKSPATGVRKTTKSPGATKRARTPAATKRTAA